MTLNITILSNTPGSQAVAFDVEAPSVEEYLVQEQIALSSEECFSSFTVIDGDMGKALVANKLPYEYFNEPGETRVYIVKAA